MADQQPRKIFLNISVRELKHSMEFFKQLGFSFNPKFTDDKAACMIVSNDAYVMLITEPFFRTFTNRAICNTATHTEALFALSSSSRSEVDELVTRQLPRAENMP